ncbi:MAG: hypothetical protein HS111_06585 [Kofleriaceae bacterium]|nr:hypothetical protein [Kofleriaceae bacterium]
MLGSEPGHALLVRRPQARRSARRHAWARARGQAAADAIGLSRGEQVGALPAATASALAIRSSTSRTASSRWAWAAASSATALGLRRGAAPAPSRRPARPAAPPVRLLAAASAAALQGLVVLGRQLGSAGVARSQRPRRGRASAAARGPRLLVVRGGEGAACVLAPQLLAQGERGRQRAGSPPRWGARRARSRAAWAANCQVRDPVVALSPVEGGLQLADLGAGLGLGGGHRGGELVDARAPDAAASSASSPAAWAWAAASRPQGSQRRQLAPSLRSASPSRRDSSSQVLGVDRSLGVLELARQLAGVLGSRSWWPSSSRRVKSSLS